MAAVTATRLRGMLFKEREFNFSGIFMWTDSTTITVDQKQRQEATCLCGQRSSRNFGFNNSGPRE